MEDTYNTADLSIKPNVFRTEKWCIKKREEEENTITNKKYNRFDQTIFTAGDVDQFLHYSGLNIERDIPFINMFNYLFYKIRGGIFVEIKDNSLIKFIPFVNVNFKNEWSDRLESRGISYYVRNFHPMKINIDKSQWWTNNYMIRVEYPPKYGEHDVVPVKDFINTLCNERKIPDSRFFINRRDFPVLKIDRTEPYDAIWPKPTPLISHNYGDQYATIFSFSKTKEFEDCLLPPMDDWKIVTGKYYLHKTDNTGSCSHIDKVEIKTKWEDKIELAIFRGKATGYGSTPEENLRLKAAKLSQNFPLLMDVGIVKRFTRPYIELLKEDALAIRFSRKITDFNLPLVPFMNKQEQERYKYILHIQGHVAAYRLGSDLSMNSVVLKVKSDFFMWFEEYLQENVHYISIESDLSDLVKKINYCKKNDSICKEIAKKSLLFVNEYLTKDSMLDYMVDMIHKIKYK